MAQRFDEILNAHLDSPKDREKAIAWAKRAYWRYNSRVESIRSYYVIEHAGRYWVGDWRDLSAQVPDAEAKLSSPVFEANAQTA